jgi:hypothetical protein
VIVVATESHRKSLFQRLLASGVDDTAAIEQGFYLPLDVDETLSTFMVNDLPDAVRFMNLPLRCGRKIGQMRQFRSNT